MNLFHGTRIFLTNIFISISTIFDFFFIYNKRWEINVNDKLAFRNAFWHLLVLVSVFSFTQFITAIHYFTTILDLLFFFFIKILFVGLIFAQYIFHGRRVKKWEDKIWFNAEREAYYSDVFRIAKRAGCLLIKLVTRFRLLQYRKNNSIVFHFFFFILKNAK